MNTKLGRAVLVCALVCLASPAAAGSPCIPSPDLATAFDVDSQALRIECGADTTDCRFTMSLSGVRPREGVPLDVASWTKGFPEDWKWFTVGTDGAEAPLSGSSVSASLVVRGRLRFNDEPWWGLESHPESCDARRSEAIFVRHPWLASTVDREARLPTFRARRIDVRVDPPDAVTWETKNGELRIIAGRDVGPVMRFGGPFVGLGGSAQLPNRQGDGRFRLRAGYEIARPRFLIHSVAVETTFRDLFVIPATELAVASFWGLAHSAGVGVPVRLDDPTVGVRFQVGLHAPVLGFLLALDVFPALPNRERTIGSFAVQLSF